MSVRARRPRPRLALLFVMSILALCLHAAARPATAQQPMPSIVPAPTSVEPGTGHFTIDESTRIAVSHPGSRELRAIAEYVAIPLREATGFAIEVIEGDPAGDASGLIVLEAGAGAAAAAADPYDWSDGLPENYSLEVSPVRVRLRSPSLPGLFRGVQTLRQLLPPAFEDGYAATHGREWRSDESANAGANRTPGWRPADERSLQDAAGGGAGSAAGSSVGDRQPHTTRAATDWSIPAVTIEDSPRFPWRGMHLDVGRHWFPPAFILKYIDLIAAQRMNVFHWHLTEDQGWRIEIAKYPRLTDVSAFRRETMLARNFDPYVGDGVPYGGFYTQEEIRRIVEYAASRYVTIVPEIEMPGHSVAVLAAYPELACTSGPFEVATVWGVMPDIYCPHERTFDFLEDVLTEVLELFPGRYIHVGGDEAPKTVWQQSDIAQEVIRREALADEQGLQSWFIRRIERFLNANDRRLVGWDEILEGGLAPEATVMSWRGMQGGIDAARAGHDVVMSPTSHVYFDYYQGDPEHEPLAIGGFLPLERVYSFEPVPEELSPAEATHVLGAQGNVWTEYMKTADRVEYMAVPRMLALSEVVWSPAAARDWTGFLHRLPAALERMGRLGVDYRVPDVQGLESDRLTLGDTVHVTLSAPIRGAVIRYSLDGSDPTGSSPEYDSPLALSVDPDGLIVSARAFLPDGRASAVSRARFAKTTLRPPDRTTREDLAGGLRYEYFEGSYRSADAVRGSEPLRTGVASAVALQGPEREERFALRFTGYIRAHGDGIHTFSLSSDDGSRMRIGGALVIDHDGLHGPSALGGQVALAAGWHAVEITYFQAGGGRSLDLRVAAPGRALTPVAPESFAHSPSGGLQR